ncbi:MAG: hypothetical protein ACMUHM_00790 [Thermoplasmatota archaeon]
MVDRKIDGKNGPVKVKAALIDPVSMSVLWMNEAASHDLPPLNDTPISELKLEEAIPMAKVMGLPDALKIAVDTGAPQNLRTSLIPSARGTMSVVSSVYPLPDGKLLLLSELGWEAKPRDKGRTERIRSGRGRL